MSCANHAVAGSFLAALTGALVALAGLGGSYVVPLDHDAIQYAARPVTDPVAKLQQGLASGEVTLEFDESTGYLPAVLKALNVPRESQVLVFSKTSFQAPRISPRMPRAIYFNDSVSVGWVRSGDVVEVASIDPKQGVIFYTLDQEKTAKPRFERRDTCLQCHASGATVGVPGLVVQIGISGAIGHAAVYRRIVRYGSSKPVQGTLGRMVRLGYAWLPGPHGKCHRP